MSVNKKIFNFKNPLPEPFDKVTNKIISVSSKYGDGTKATLSSTIIKAVLAYCKCKDGTGLGALGLLDQKGIAEYKSEAPDIYDLAVYDSSTGTILASKYDTNTDMMNTYTVSTSGEDGSAVFFSMLPAFFDDQEFGEQLEAYYTEHSSGYPDLSTATKLMAILCDNIYRRLTDESCSAHVKLNLETGNTTRVAQSHLDSGVFTPKTVLAGEFKIFAQTGPAPVLSPTDIIEHSDFISKYALTPGRTFSAQEQNLVPQLEPWYILPLEIVNICKHACVSTEKATPMRNFLLRGPAGTGKTEGAKAIASGLGLPYMKYTCSANTEVFDFVGQVFPETDTPSTGDAMLDQERKTLKEMGGITYENVAKLMALPDLDDMDFDPEGVYQKLTGITKNNATSQECMAVVMDKVADKIQKLSRIKPDTKGSGQTYTYIETDFIKALKYGYLIELQEPSTIMQPGVLVGLNSLLEQTGSITLPTGEIIKRHPDAVVVVTTNIDYEGCRGMNQSVLDRMSLVQDVELPSPEIMAQRAMSVTGCEDDFMVSQMVQVVNDMADYCRKNGISDGAYGMRSLIDWIISTEITEDAYTSALYTIISKATADEEDRQALISTVLEPLFAPKRRKKAI